MNKLLFRIDDLFDVSSGKTVNLQDLPKGNVPYISATENNNGIGGYIDKDPDFEGNLITVSRNGSVAEVFYQPKPFCASLDDVRILTPKEFELNKYIGLYISTILRKEKFRYTYGRKFGTNRIKQTEILLPVTDRKTPNWEYITSYIKEIVKVLPKRVKPPINNKINNAPVINNDFVINDVIWKKFFFRDVFFIKKGYYNKKPEHTESGEIPFIGATDNNNGITEYYSEFDIETHNKDSRSGDHPLEDKIFKGNCITVSNNGSVGYAFYQEKDFTCSHDVNVLYLKDRDWNKYIAMFICTLIGLERYRWAYGRKWRPSRMPNSIIKLPVTQDGKPDWEFMENYIKSLPYSASI